jgi:hypothetical protein
MAPIRPPGDQNITDYTANPATWNENSLALTPNPVQFFKESLVLIDTTELPPAGIRSIGFEIEVGRRRNDEMHRFVRYRPQLASVAEDHFVSGPLVGHWPSTPTKDSIGL